MRNELRYYEPSLLKNTDIDKKSTFVVRKPFIACLGEPCQ